MNSEVAALAASSRLLVRSILEGVLQMGIHFCGNGLAIVDISSICMDIASGDANGPAGPMARTDIS